MNDAKAEGEGSVRTYGNRTVIGGGAIVRDVDIDDEDADLGLDGVCDGDGLFGLTGETALCDHVLENDAIGIGGGGEGDSKGEVDDLVGVLGNVDIGEGAIGNVDTRKKGTVASAVDLLQAEAHDIGIVDGDAQVHVDSEGVTGLTDTCGALLDGANTQDLNVRDLCGGDDDGEYDDDNDDGGEKGEEDAATPEGAAAAATSASLVPAYTAAFAARLDVWHSILLIHANEEGRRGGRREGGERRGKRGKR